MEQRGSAPVTPPLAAGDAAAVRAAVAEPLHRGVSPRFKAVAAAVVVALLVFPHLFDSPFSRHVMIMVFLYALMAQSWNILAGYCGQISLGHAVFFGIGAYASAYPFATWGVSPWFGLLIGIGLAMGVAVIIGVPTLRLRGHYFAIATLLIGESVQIVFLRWDRVGAASGIWLPIVREHALWNFQFNESKLPYYYIALTFLGCVCAAVHWLDRSRMGYYFRAVREDPDAAASLGINVARYKDYAFMLSAAFMAMAGTFYAQYVLVVDPETVFPFTLSILVVLMAVMGGVGTLWGPLIGAAVLVPLSEATRIYFGGTGEAVDLIIYGALIVLICIFKPEGLVGLWAQSHPHAPAPGGEGDRDHA